jgi:hypothetical protein
MTRLAAHGAAFVQGIRECGCEIGFRIGSMERMRLCEFRYGSKVLGFMEVQRVRACELWFWGSDCGLGLVGWFCEREFRIEVDGFGAGFWRGGAYAFLAVVDEDAGDGDENGEDDTEDDADGLGSGPLERHGQYA